MARRFSHASHINTLSRFDANSNLVAITDQNGATRRFVNDQSGHVLEKTTQYVGSTVELINGLSAAAALAYLNQTDWAGYLPGTLNQGTISREDDPGINSHLTFADVSQTPVTHVLVANGEVMAETGGAYQVANFNAAYRQIDASYPSATPGSYTVQAGDNLSSIARAVWGDASLWYLIAEANGLTAGAGGSSQAISGANSATNPTSPGDLRVGQVLTIPNKVTNLHHNINTFTPYDPSKIIGDTTPQVSAPAPQADGGGCGGFGQVLVAVVAIVVTAIVTFEPVH